VKAASQEVGDAIVQAVAATAGAASARPVAASVQHEFEQTHKSSLSTL